MSVSHPETGAPRPSVRRPRRASYPDLGPKLPTRCNPGANPVQSRLWIEIGGRPHAVKLEPREPGDEAVELVRLIDPAGRAVVCAETWDGYECDCGRHAEGAPCIHVAALRAAGLFGCLPALVGADRFTVAEEGGGR